MSLLGCGRRVRMEFVRRKRREGFLGTRPGGECGVMMDAEVASRSKLSGGESERKLGRAEGR